LIINLDTHQKLPYNIIIPNKRGNKMKIVIAIDSFKGSISSIEAGTAVSKGIYRVFPDAEISIYPLADGGEGTVNALVNGLGGTFRNVFVSDPLGRGISAEYGILPDKTAVIEMASAAGITLLSENERNPMHTTTYGVGQMIADAISHGCRNFIIGIGGSSTNDGGIGCLQALGFDMLDSNGKQVEFGAAGLSQLSYISDNNALPCLSECKFQIACDVTNPLYGENGCSAVFAPQKGADSAMVAELDKYMKKYAELTKGFNPTANPETAGAGAAGGLGFAFVSYLNASLESGIDLVLRKIKLEDAVRNADIVITGEGCLDAQSIMGKAPVGVAKLAKKYDKPVIAFCGIAKDENILCNNSEIDAYFPILRNICTTNDAMNPENAKRNLAFTAQQVFRIIDKFMK
jgi:glycerate kinase